MKKYTERELILLEICKSEYDKIMDFLDNKYPKIYSEIWNRQLEDTKKELAELHFLLNKKGEKNDR